MSTNTPEEDERLLEERRTKFIETTRKAGLVLRNWPRKRMNSISDRLHDRGTMSARHSRRTLR
jgi:hypothetical protein